MHEVAIFIKADLFEIGDPPSEENGRHNKADLSKTGDPSSEENGRPVQSLILKSQFTLGGQYNISKNTVGPSTFCIKPRSTPCIAG